MKILITGASGFTGRAMIQYLISQGERELYSLLHISHNSSVPDQAITTINGDLLDQTRVREILADVRPACIIHLAGLNKGSLHDMIMTNAIGTQNLLEAIDEEDLKCRILIVSSSAVYGNAGDKPISETAPLNPQSAYGISKVAQELVGKMAYARNGMQVAIARPFNLVGPGQPESFVCGGIITQIKRMGNRGNNTLRLFELQSRRDFIDVRDVVRAYWSIVHHPLFDEKCTGRTFNIGSGIAYSVADIVHMIEEITGVSYKISLPNIPPPILIPTQQSNNTLIKEITGWSPEIPFKTSLSDMLAEVSTSD